MTKSKKKKIVTADTSKSIVGTWTMTQEDVLFLRDLFNIKLFSKDERTVSGALSELQCGSDRLDVEIWAKIEEICRLSGVPTGAGAPDYVIMQEAPSPVSLYFIDEGEDE